MSKLNNLQKILIAEDLESISAGIERTLKDFSPEQITHTRYCDDAWLKLKKAELDGEPYDLLITDLSFKPDHREVELKGGEDLINAIRKDHISCKIIVFSIEDKPLKVQSFFEEFHIDAYVLKSRKDSLELAKAFRSLILGETYISDAIKRKMHSQKNMAQVEEIDLLIIRQLCEGMTQEEIRQLFQERNIKPNSSSTIEKRLKSLREDFHAKTNIELVLMFKELGLV